MPQHTPLSGPAPLGTLAFIALLLTIVGGINWGLVGLFDFDLVAALFGEGSMLTRAVYAIVGVSALVGLVSLVSHRSAR